MKTHLTRFAVTAVALLLAANAWAFPSVARSTKLACATCHTNVSGGAELNDAGKAYKADATKVPAASAEANDYVGSKKCKSCHLKEYNSWTTLDHAKAMETLKGVAADKANEIAGKLNVKLAGKAADDPNCIGCHSVGFQMGGYPAADDSTKNAGLAVVGCESCHGPGAKHVAAEKTVKKNFIDGKPGEKMCKDCHTAAMSPKFDFATYKTKGVHEMKTAE